MYQVFTNIKRGIFNLKYAIILSMRNEQNPIPTGEQARIFRRITTNQEIESERRFRAFKRMMEETPYSKAKRDILGHPIGERHTNGFKNWLAHDLENYTGR